MPQQIQGYVPSNTANLAPQHYEQVQQQPAQISMSVAAAPQSQPQPQPQQSAPPQVIEPTQIQVRKQQQQLTAPNAGVDHEFETIMNTVKSGSEGVLTRYLPCVEFLVQCQQELRAGLEVALRKSRYRGRGMTPHQFYTTNVDHLPMRFREQSMNRMPEKFLNDAINDLMSLCRDARAAESGGCEAVKNAFLGGMKEGESWGLRKWLSRHGSALTVCSDLEDILQKVQKMDRDSKRTIEIGKQIRNISSYTLKRLRGDVPKAYQEVSTAHPYLPFFHRLESALQGLAWFDPEDDDVICLDDDEVEQEKQKSQEKKSSCNNAVVIHSIEDTKKPAAASSSWSETFGDVNGDSLLHQLNNSEWECQSCTFQNDCTAMNCLMCETARPLHSEGTDDLPKATATTKPATATHDIPAVQQSPREPENGVELAIKVESLDFGDRSHAVLFWDRNWKFVLDLFCRLLRKSACKWVLDLESTDTDVINHPVGFRDIVETLLSQRGNGKLPRYVKVKWSVYKMDELLQAIDLALLNTLALTGPSKSLLRTDVLALRRYFWSALERQVNLHSGSLPTKRTEKSGFVVNKKTKK
uniref:RanBP2-type domain-containing protein n=1 Tax=Leptocylindrus danicus TaxID=163516 RepID=A0A7S2LRZ5_9STRA